MAKVNLDALQGNSYSESESPKKEVTKVTTGAVTRRDKPLLLRIFGESMREVGGYVLWEVLVPSVKDVITEMVSNGIEMLIYGNDSRSLGRSSRRSGRRRMNDTYVSYSGMYNDSSIRRRSTREEVSRTAGRHAFDDILFGNRGDADLVLSKLLELIDAYGSATVADFYSAVGLETQYQDQNWGWDSLAQARPRRVRDGYILEMPRPLALD